MQELSIEYVPIDSITPYEANAKLHPAEQIAQIKKSIQDYGFRDPVGIWQGQIVEGHGRIIAAKELGLTEVPVIKLDDMTDEQRREYALVHNQTTLNSGFDFSVLDAEIEGLPEFDAAFYGFLTSLDDDEENVEEPEDENPTDVLPDSRILGFSVSVFGTNSECFVDIVLSEEETARLLELGGALPDLLGAKIKEALDAL